MNEHFKNRQPIDDVEGMKGKKKNNQESKIYIQLRISIDLTIQRLSFFCIARAPSPHLQPHPRKPQSDGDDCERCSNGPVYPELAGHGRATYRLRIPLEERHGEKRGDKSARQEEYGDCGEGFHRR